jgi:hypothetical protein
MNEVQRKRKGDARDPLATNTVVPAPLSRALGRGGQMISFSSGTSTLPKPRIIPNFKIDQETLDHLKTTSPIHYLVAIACLKDGRWRLTEHFEEARYD